MRVKEQIEKLAQNHQKDHKTDFKMDQVGLGAFSKCFVFGQMICCFFGWLVVSWEQGWDVEVKYMSGFVLNMAIHVPNMT